MIRPEDLSPPGWTQLAPTEPLLPPVPFVVSRRFGEDLATWRAPELSLGTLAHGVSDEAPSGIISAIPVAAEAPAVPFDDAFLQGESLGVLPLAHQPAAETWVNEAGVADLRFPSRREITGPEIVASSPPVHRDRADDVGPSSPGTGLPLAGPPASTATGRPVDGPVPAVRPAPGNGPAGAPPATGGTATPPAGTATPPAGTATPPAATATPLAGTATPAAEAIAPPAGTATPAAGITAPAAEAIAPTVGSLAPPIARPAADAVPAVRSLVEAAVPAQLPVVQLNGERSVQPALELAVPAGAPRPGMPGAEVGIDRPGPAPVEAVAPLLGDRDEAGEPARPAESGQSTMSPALDLAGRPGVAVNPDQVVREAPGAPGAPSTGGTATEPAAPKKSGLGAPLSHLPPTAASLDAASIAASYAQRSRTPRATPGSIPLAQLSLAVASAARSGVPVASRPAPPAGTRFVTYAEVESLPMVRPERLAGPQTGTEHGGQQALPPAPQSSVALAPFQALGYGNRPVEETPVSTEGRPTSTEGRNLKTAIGRRHGVDLDGVAIDRSPASASRAQAMGADAFSSPGVVVVPPVFGSLESGPGRAVLAHELTHAAQQMRAGQRAMPSEHSPAGRTLEAEAVATELSLAPPSLLARGPATAPPGSAPSARARVSPGRGTGPIPALPVARHDSKQIDEAGLAAALMRLNAVSNTALATSTPQVSAPAAMSVPAAPAPAAAAPVQRAASAPAPPASSPAAGPAAADTGGVFSERPNDSELAQLASWLYPLISFKIRGELRSDRERAGNITDSYRRW